MHFWDWMTRPLSTAWPSIGTALPAPSCLYALYCTYMHYDADNEHIQKIGRYRERSPLSVFCNDCFFKWLVFTKVFLLSFSICFWVCFSSKICVFSATFSFLVDLRKGVDDFMGRAFYLLGTIPTKGERRTLNLYSHSAKAKLGSIKVDLRIRGLREGLSKDEAMMEHLRLTRAVVDSESRAVSHIFIKDTLRKGQPVYKGHLSCPQNLSSPQC